MRRLTAGLACVAAAALIAPATATAAHARSKPTPPNPLTALQKQLAAGAGVTYRSSTYLKNTLAATATATFRFNRSGLAASDLTTRLQAPPAALGKDATLALRPERTIRIGDTTYVNSALLRKRFPTDHPLVEAEGRPDATLLREPLTTNRPWIETRNGPATGLLGSFGQLINPTEPATLRTLLAQRPATRSGGKVNGVKTTAYRGTVTVGRLYQVSPWLREALLVKPSPQLARTKIDWELYVGADGLPRRLVSAWSPQALGLGKQRLFVDSRYTSWGANVRVTPPADDKVVQVGRIQVGSPLAR